VIFLVMGAALSVLMLWSIACTARVVRRSSPRVWIWWACWLVVGAVASQALLAQGLEAMGWGR
jgi:hypothetical protein